MSILGMGTEIVECLRIAKLIEQHGERFLNRVFTDREVCECQERVRPVEHFAARWAAKEAVLRAIGLGKATGIARNSLEIRLIHGRTPEVGIRGAAREEAAARGIGAILVSLAHCRTYATAHALALTHHVPPPRRSAP